MVSSRSARFADSGIQNSGRPGQKHAERFLAHLDGPRKAVFFGLQFAFLRLDFDRIIELTGLRGTIDQVHCLRLVVRAKRDFGLCQHVAFAFFTQDEGGLFPWKPMAVSLHSKSTASSTKTISSTNRSLSARSRRGRLLPRPMQKSGTPRRWA